MTTYFSRNSKSKIYCTVTTEGHLNLNSPISDNSSVYTILSLYNISQFSIQIKDFLFSFSCEEP